MHYLNISRYVYLQSVLIELMKNIPIEIIEPEVRTESADLIEASNTKEGRRIGCVDLALACTQAVGSCITSAPEAYEDWSHRSPTIKHSRDDRSDGGIGFDFRGNAADAGEIVGWQGCVLIEDQEPRTLLLLREVQCAVVGRGEACIFS